MGLAFQVRFLLGLLLLVWDLAESIGRRHEYDVQVRDAGPLGLELSELLVVRGFVRGSQGQPPALQLQGGVEINDELIAVNDKVLKGAIMHALEK
jgi:hypothetical protein